MDLWFSQNSQSKIRILRDLLIVAFVLAILLYTYTWKYLSYDALKIPENGFELRVVPGTSVRQFIKQLNTDGLLSHPNLMTWYVALVGANHIQAGEYKLDPGMTPLQVLAKVEAGQVAQYSFTIVEGWQTSQLLQELQHHPKIKTTLAGFSQEQIIQKLEIPVKHLEGVFLPDTYFFVADTTDVEFLRRAYYSLEHKLREAWPKRSPDCKVKSPYEALILASIIEKETSIKTEYDQIAGVFTRRLAQNMKLQADPTVIYAYQNNLSGTLSRKHLKIDSPYNTYKNVGLPPTPIALPSVNAINAALNPAGGDALYFVATGDGGHVFSANLIDHNAAVKRLYTKK